MAPITTSVGRAAPPTSVTLKSNYGLTSFPPGNSHMLLNFDYSSMFDHKDALHSQSIMSSAAGPTGDAISFEQQNKSENNMYKDNLH
jgi:hypothetical protein